MKVASLRAGGRGGTLIVVSNLDALIKRSSGIRRSGSDTRMAGHEI